MAALIACVVQTLNESDPTFQKRFLKRLERGYDVIREDTEGEPIYDADGLSLNIASFSAAENLFDLRPVMDARLERI